MYYGQDKFIGGAGGSAFSSTGGNGHFGSAGDTGGFPGSGGAGEMVTMPLVLVQVVLLISKSFPELLSL